MSSRMLALCVAALVAVALLAGGCGTTAGAGDLEGTDWVLESWSVSSQDPQEFETTASFADDAISGRAAVNTYNGGYTAEPDGAFSVGEIASTLMAGSEAAMSAEQTYFELLKEAAEYRIDGETLTLSDVDGNELLVFAAK